MYSFNNYYKMLNMVIHVFDSSFMQLYSEKIQCLSSNFTLIFFYFFSTECGGKHTQAHIHTHTPHHNNTTQKQTNRVFHGSCQYLTWTVFASGFVRSSGPLLRLGQALSCLGALAQAVPSALKALYSGSGWLTRPLSVFQRGITTLVYPFTSISFLAFLFFSSKALNHFPTYVIYYLLCLCFFYSLLFLLEYQLQEIRGLYLLVSQVYCKCWSNIWAPLSPLKYF